MHSRTCQLTSSSRCRRRSPLDSARSTGRHRIGRGIDAFGRQEVLHPEAGAGTTQSGRDRTGRRPALGSHRAGVLAVHLVRHQQISIGRGQVGKRGADDRSFLLAQQARGRRLHLRSVHPRVRAASGAVVPLGVGGNDVSCRDRGVVRQPVGLDAHPSTHHPGQGLLHQVLHGVRILDPRPHDSTKHGDQVDDDAVITRPVIARRGLGHHELPPSHRASCDRVPRASSSTPTSRSGYRPRPDDPGDGYGRGPPPGGWEEEQRHLGQTSPFYDRVGSTE